MVLRCSALSRPILSRVGTRCVQKNGRIEELERQLAAVKKESFDKLLEDMEDVYK